VLAVAVTMAEAAACGGGVPCGCGDTVTADHQLRENLGPCPGHGLIVKSGAKLDCGGRSITGLRDGSEQYGVVLDGRPNAEVTGVTVASCHVSGFLRGIRLRAARGNTITGNVVTGNGNFKTHEGYGIDVAGGSVDNLIEKNRVHQSADEGVHIGRGSHGNRVVGNEITDNHRESLYVLASDRGIFLGNTLGNSGVNSAYVKDASGNRFESNRFVGRPVRVIGAARDNLFARNTFAGASLHFQDYKGGQSPSRNRVTGGTMTGGRDYCVRFTNSGDNTIADLPMSGCRVIVRAESPARPTQNTVVGLGAGAVELDEGSTLRLGRRVEVRVTDGAGQPVAGAEVEGRDESGRSLWTAVTDAAGAIPPQFTIVRTRTGSGPAREAGGPIVVRAAKPGLGAGEEKVAPDGPAALRMTLKGE
jgi:parallel beta-helix repeat protein